jgi:cell division protein FtsW
MDVAPIRPVTLPDTGIGHGWEATVLLVATLVLLCFGLVTLYSASGFLAQRQNLPDWHYVVLQAGGAAIGLVVLWGCSRIPLGFWEDCAWPLLLAVIAMLVAIILPGTTAIAPEINGARRWLVLWGVTLQPSELAKIAVVVWTARVAVRQAGQFQSLSRGLLPLLVVWGAVLFPVLLEPDLSTACLIALLGSLVVFAAGGRIGHFLFLGALTFPVVQAQLGVSFRAHRMLASGGPYGVGFGEGRQKFGFLPEAHNDFIFAMVGEEWGLLGVVFLLSLYTTLVVVGLRIARRAPDEFSQLLAVGLIGIVGVQALLHMAVGLGLVPPTGIALPLVSYGRSNQIVTLASVGMLIAVARATDPRATDSIPGVLWPRWRRRGESRA